MENTYFKATEGFVFQRIIDGYVMGEELYLGTFIDGTPDSIFNYIEISKDNTFVVDSVTSGVCENQ